MMDKFERVDFTPIPYEDNKVVIATISDAIDDIVKLIGFDMGKGDATSVHFHTWNPEQDTFDINPIDMAVFLNAPAPEDCIHYPKRIAYLEGVKGLVCFIGEEEETSLPFPPPDLGAKKKEQ